MHMVLLGGTSSLKDFCKFGSAESSDWHICIFQKGVLVLGSPSALVLTQDVVPSDLWGGWVLVQTLSVGLREFMGLFFCSFLCFWTKCVWRGESGKQDPVQTRIIPLRTVVVSWQSRTLKNKSSFNFSLRTQTEKKTTSPNRNKLIQREVLLKLDQKQTPDTVLHFSDWEV